jgi:hypothetical protein
MFGGREKGEYGLSQKAHTDCVWRTPKTVPYGEHDAVCASEAVVGIIMGSFADQMQR